MGDIVGYTPQFGFKLINYNVAPWQNYEYDNWRTLDALLAQYMTLTQLKGLWQNSTAYNINERTVDATDATIWKANDSFTTEVAPTTFAEHRALHPSYWTQVQSNDFEAQQALAEAAAAAQAAAEEAAAAAAFGALTKVASAVLCADTNINLSVANLPTIDGSSPSYGDTVLLVGQDDATQNGLYVVRAPGSGGWYRHTDMDSNADIDYPIWLVRIEGGGAYTGVGFLLVSDGDLVLGSDDLNFRQLGHADVVAPLQYTGGAISMPAATTTNDGMMTKEMVSALENVLHTDETQTWSAIQTFSVRARFLVDITFKSNDSYTMIVKAASNHNKSNTYQFPNTGSGDANIAVLGTEPTMSDGTVGSRFVGNMGFYNHTPVVQQARPTVQSTTVGTYPSGSEFNGLVNRFNLLVDRLVEYGLLAP